MPITPDNQSQQQAAGKIGIAIRRLADKYPFHAAILERFEIMHRADIATMAVTVRGDKVALLFNAEFFIPSNSDFTCSFFCSWSSEASPGRADPL